MRILQAHKYYWPRDGASKYMLELSGLLKNAGHEVIPFAMQNAQNIPTQYRDYFVSDVDLSGSTQMSPLESVEAAARMVYSFEAKRKIARLLEKTKPEIAHLHNIYHHISPSILPEIKKRGIPIVVTLHDYKLLSPNYSLYHHGSIHEEDARGYYFSCIKNKCVKDSRAKSIFSVAEMIFHHKVMRYYERYVDRFISPSMFMIDLCVKHGWDRTKFVHIPHPVTPVLSSPGISTEKFVLFHGRLSEEKGLDVLLSAAQLTPDIHYKIVGTGPMERQLRERIRLERIRNVILLGFQTGNALQQTIAGAYVIVAPSVWFENQPLSILEAKAAGKIVIGSRIGGIPEMLPDDLLVPAGDAEALAQKIRQWYGISTDAYQARGLQLQDEVKRVNDSGAHVQTVVSVYQSLVSHTA